MILIALFALTLVGADVTLLARAGALPRIQAARRLDEIATDGAVGSSMAGEQASSRSVLLEGVATRLGSVVARRFGAREDDLRRHLMAAGVYRLSPTALLGYR